MPWVFCFPIKWGSRGTERHNKLPMATVLELILDLCYSRPQLSQLSSKRWGWLTWEICALVMWKTAKALCAVLWGQTQGFQTESMSAGGADLQVDWFSQWKSWVVFLTVTLRACRQWRSCSESGNRKCVSLRDQLFIVAFLSFLCLLVLSSVTDFCLFFLPLYLQQLALCLAYNR